MGLGLRVRRFVVWGVGRMRCVVLDTSGGLKGSSMADSDAGWTGVNAVTIVGRASDIGGGRLSGMGGQGG